MSSRPIICFGQQPCGFFPKRFLVAKIFTARKLQQQIGGEIVFFFHDADHDPRETQTTLRDRRFGDSCHFNFECENKLQRKFSPLFLKRFPPQWQFRTTRRLPPYVDPRWVEAFQQVTATNVADFCLDMLRRMGLLDGPGGGITVVRSGDPAVRRAACAVPDYFVDVPHNGQIVRARVMDGALKLHEGGESYLTIPTPAAPFTKDQISPTRDTRLKWMQSVIHCTHYIAGAGEQQYLNKSDAPEIQFLQRDPIDRSDEAWTEVPA